VALPYCPKRRPRPLPGGRPQGSARGPLRPRRYAAVAFAVLIVAAAAVGTGLMRRDAPPQAVRDGEDLTPAAGGAPAARGGDEESPTSSRGALEGSRSTFDAQKALSSGGEEAAVPATGRATDAGLWLELRLRDAHDVSAAAKSAMSITRELGGWVAASNVDTHGLEGRASSGSDFRCARSEKPSRASPTAASSPGSGRSPGTCRRA
jgi:hypothetical protein